MTAVTNLAQDRGGDEWVRSATPAGSS
jgi:hypothetical protein